MQLNIHLHQRLLHVLDVRRRTRSGKGAIAAGFLLRCNRFIWLLQ
jgi:hypothetical protein